MARNDILTVNFKQRLLITLTYMLNVAFGYLLMLIVMSYNAGIFISTIIGLTTGYLIFGYLKKKRSVMLQRRQILKHQEEPGSSNGAAVFYEGGNKEC